MNRLWRLVLWLAYRGFLVYWFLFRPTERGVYVALWCRGRVLLIRNSYKSGDTLPAGRVKAAEDPAHAACRELAEEVGIRLEPSRLRLFGTFESRAEFKLDRSTVFEIELDREPVVTIDQREVIRAEFVDAAEALERDLTAIVRQYFAAK